MKFEKILEFEKWKLEKYFCQKKLKFTNKNLLPFGKTKKRASNFENLSITTGTKNMHQKLIDEGECS